MMKPEFFAATLTVLGGHGVKNTQIKNKLMHTLNVEWPAARSKTKTLYTLWSYMSTTGDARRRQNR
jgi:hypothetical protein